VRVDTSEALAAQLAAEAWDVLFLDVKMPSFSAMAALEVLRSFHIDVPVIVVSGEVGEEARRGTHAGWGLRLPQEGAPREAERHDRPRTARGSSTARAEARSGCASRVGRGLSLRNRFAGVFLTVPDDGMYDAVLRIVLEVMHSPMGFFGCLNQDGALIVQSMIGDGWDQGQMAEASNRFPREMQRNGLWDQAIAEGRSLFENCGGRTPEGLVAIDCVLVVPILHQDAVIGLSSSPTGTSATVRPTPCCWSTWPTWSLRCFAYDGSATSTKSGAGRPSRIYHAAWSSFAPPQQLSST